MDEKHLLSQFILARADDEFILGHRNSEWCGHAPILEEDISFANLALDELGHAILWYQFFSELVNEDPERYPDQLAFFRAPELFRNSQLVALPKGDWAVTMLRQYLFDVFENITLNELANSRSNRISEIANKILREEIYHLRHSTAWVKRLGLGTEESNIRMQNALNLLWPYGKQLFLSSENIFDLVKQQLIPDPEKTWISWKTRVSDFLGQANLKMPQTEFLEKPRTEHEDFFYDMISEMQKVARSDPEARW